MGLAVEFQEPITILRMTEFLMAILVLSMAAASNATENFLFRSPFGGWIRAVSRNLVTFVHSHCYNSSARQTLVNQFILTFTWCGKSSRTLFVCFIDLAADHAGTRCCGITPNFCSIGKANAAMYALNLVSLCITTYDVIVDSIAIGETVSAEEAYIQEPVQQEPVLPASEAAVPDTSELLSTRLCRMFIFV